MHVADLLRPPFASGLPLTPDELNPIFADPRGCALLHLIRDLARDEMAALAPACRDRRSPDYVERWPADPVAVAQHRTYAAIVVLIGEILQDTVLSQRLAAALAEHFPDA